MDDVVLLAIAAVAAAAAVLAAVLAGLALERASRSARESADAFADIDGELADVRRGIAELARNAAAEGAAGSQRHEAIVHALAGGEARGVELRREVSSQLERNRSSMDERLDRISEATRSELKEMRGAIESQLTAIRSDTGAQLERMRETVDEKLQKTLNARIAQSFELVNKQLSEVSHGLGEMQSLAQDVGGLKRVLSNVKARGIVGEIQLGAILREILTPAQYAENVATVPGSRARVEFAVRLPGESGETVWLPIDSKFPGDSYDRLRRAQEEGDAAAVDAAWKILESRIRREAKDIHEKYVSPPDTTAFGILFLPFEGLYAEVVNRPGLLEDVQRTYRVNITGPSTMAALLNSLQMGFQTVAIQKRAAEIQNVLAAVKTEFGTYHEALAKARRQLDTVNKTVDHLLGARTNKMNKALSDVTELESLAEAERVLGIDGADADEIEGE